MAKKKKKKKKKKERKKRREEKRKKRTHWLCDGWCDWSGDGRGGQQLQEMREERSPSGWGAWQPHGALAGGALADGRGFLREGWVKADPRVLGPGGYLVDKEPLAEMRKQVLVGRTEVLFQYFTFEMLIRSQGRC